MHRGGAEAPRHLQPLLHRVDREDLRGPRGHGRLHCAKSHRAQAQHRYGVARSQPRVGDGVVTGTHHVAGEQRHLVGHALRHPAKGEVGARHEQLLSLGPLQIAEVGAVAEGAAALTAMVVAAQAGAAGGAGNVEAAENPVANGHPLHIGPRGEHRADELVADRETGLDRHAPVVDVEVRAADPARLDPHHRLVRSADLRVRLLVDPNLSGSLKGDRSHGRNLSARLADADAGDLEAAGLYAGARGLGDARFQRQLALEVGLLPVRKETSLPSSSSTKISTKRASSCLPATRRSSWIAS